MKEKKSRNLSKTQNWQYLTLEVMLFYDIGINRISLIKIIG
jgi:hypothetical protein